MSRKLWTAVLVTVVLMLVGANLPGRLPAPWRAAGSAAWSGFIARLPGWSAAVAATAAALRDEAVARLPQLERFLRRPETLLAAAGILAALAGACVVLALSGRRRNPFRGVVRLAGRGRPIAGVARRARLAQDAVRTLLRPDRPEPRRARLHRKETSAPAGLTPLAGRRQPPATGRMRWVVSG